MRLVSLALLVSAAASPQALDQMLDQLSTVRSLKTPVISHDGRYVAWTESQPGQPSDAAKLYVSEASGAKPRRVTNSDGAEADPAFSEDGRLAFLSDTGAKNLRQLYVADKYGLGHTSRLTDVTGFLRAALGAGFQTHRRAADRGCSSSAGSHRGSDPRHRRRRQQDLPAAHRHCRCRVWQARHCFARGHVRL